LVLVASYTAKLAAHLARSEIDFQPGSFDPFFEGNSRACVLANSAYANFLRSSPNYGNLGANLVEIPNLVGSCAALESGVCDGIVNVRLKLDFVEYGGLQQHTSFKVVDELRDGPQHMAALVRSLNARPELARLECMLSYWITGLYDSGRVEELMKYEVLRGSKNLGPEIDDDMVQLDVEDMAGLYIVVFGAAIVLGLWHMFWACEERYQKEQHVAMSLEGFLDEHCVDEAEKARWTDDEGNKEITNDPLKYTDYEWISIERVLNQWDTSSDFRLSLYSPVLRCLKDARGALGNPAVWHDEHTDRTIDEAMTKQKLVSRQFKQRPSRKMQVVNAVAAFRHNGSSAKRRSSMARVRLQSSAWESALHKTSYATRAYSYKNRAKDTAERAKKRASVALTKLTKSTPLVAAQRQMLKKVLEEVYACRAVLRSQYRGARGVAPVAIRDLQRSLSVLATKTYGLDVEGLYMMERLEKVPLLKRLERDQLILLVSNFRKQKLQAGATLMAQGDPITAESVFYFIDKGSAAVYIDNEWVATREAGSYFGEKGLLEVQPRNATVKAKTELVCLCLSRSDFQNLADEHPSIRAAFDFRIECIDEAEITRQKSVQRDLGIEPHKHHPAPPQGSPVPVAAALASEPRAAATWAAAIAATLGVARK
jgi:hypothetical protein